MNKNTLISITIICVAIVAFIFISGSQTNSSTGSAVENTQMKDGVQYITINAGGEYSPRVSTAKAGIPTKLIMKTNGIYDCSASLAINSINYRKILPQTGETEIDLGNPPVGPLKGVCGMGMYSFTVNFN
jgi:plastocyanin domain-containing protein